MKDEDALVDAPSSNKRWVAATRMQAYVRKLLSQGRTWDRALFDLEDLLARRSQLSMCHAPFCTRLFFTSTKSLPANIDLKKEHLQKKNL
jgi:hypothetical protein